MNTNDKSLRLKQLKRQCEYLSDRLFDLEPGDEKHDEVFENLRDTIELIEELEND